MNIKRFAFAVFAVFIALKMVEFIVHGMLFARAYSELMSLWGPDMMEKMWVMHITNLAFALFFVYIFIKGYEGKGVAEGIRYGIIIGLFMGLGGSANQYVVYPVPLSLVVQWIVYFIIECVIFGIITAAIYKP